MAGAGAALRPGPRTSEWGSRKRPPRLRAGRRNPRAAGTVESCGKRGREPGRKASRLKKTKTRGLAAVFCGGWGWGKGPPPVCV